MKSLILSLLVVFCVAVQAGQGEQRKSAMSWLAQVDNGNYEKSWREAAPFFQDAVTTAKWENALNMVRAPLGEVVSRKVVSASSHTSLPGMPDGNYEVFNINTQFENKRMATETLTVVETDDGWRVIGYFIK